MKRYLVLVISAAILLSLLAIPATAQGLQNVELHGFLENRFYANPDGRAEITTFRVSLSAVAQLGADGTAYAEIYYHPWKTSPVYVESAYGDLPLGKGRIRIGKGRQLNFGMVPAYGNRKSVLYNSVAWAFTTSRINGIQYAYKKDAFNFGATVYTDQRVGTTALGSYPSAPASHTVSHFIDSDSSANISGELAFAARAGISTPCLKAGLSGAVGNLRQDNIATIATPYSAATTNSDHNKYGADAAYTRGPFLVQGEWYRGNFSFLEITGYTVLVGYQPKDKPRAYVRYSALDNGRSVVAGQQATYDTQQLMVTVVQPIRKGVWVELDYQKNWESTGGAPQVKNDLLLLEFFTGF